MDDSLMMPGRPFIQCGMGALTFPLGKEEASIADKIISPFQMLGWLTDYLKGLPDNIGWRDGAPMI